MTIEQNSPRLKICLPETAGSASASGTGEQRIPRGRRSRLRAEVESFILKYESEVKLTLEMWKNIDNQPAEVWVIYFSLEIMVHYL